MIIHRSDVLKKNHYGVHQPQHVDNTSEFIWTTRIELPSTSQFYFTLTSNK